jgi:hypothetical protein
LPVRNCMYVYVIYDDSNHAYKAFVYV